eukprot:TRINITY_DN10471_c0_g1_i1.p1 TRINITY_DN10471_c0_g1~~TRINITY_DN10471_c0_g1_i1.p1  ORF type:complete len:604 (-),score=158.69 TRINITY_DN10471_c0_g1_i1:305-2116(-)
MTDTKESKEVVSHSYDKEIDELATVLKEYMTYDPNPKSRAAIKTKIDELRALFFPQISFGTAGLRSRMAPGYANMNELVIIQATQGLLRFLEKDQKNCREQGVVIGWDGRYNSKEWAEVAAAVFLSQKIKVYLFSKLTSTPMVPFAVLHLKASAGIMVTASHNPKDDNGYKVYWANGAQIIQPYDKYIAESINANRKPWQPYTLDRSNKLLNDPYTPVTDAYFKQIASKYCWHRSENTKQNVRITYTAMHGVGTPYTARAFRVFDHPDFIPVKEQVEADPEFPTVKFPNPEEGKGALALAMKTADANKSTVILANDPDADRLAVAEKDSKTGEWRILNGNQIGILFADWCWRHYVQQNPKADKSKALMLASTVSSQMIKAMAEKEGFTYRGTLTGFKWMGNVAHEMQQKGYDFLFAYEVEIGFLCGNISLDKDGIRTAAMMTEMANEYYGKGSSLFDHVQGLYKKYGYFQMINSYFFCYAPKTMAAIFSRLRTMNKGTYPDMCGKYKIQSVRDVPLGIDTAFADKKSILPIVSDSHMITFRFENGTTCTLRGSGTEPKLKYYVECNSSESEAKAKELLEEMAAAIVKEFLQPELNGLVPKKVD